MTDDRELSSSFSPDLPVSARKARLRAEMRAARKALPPEEREAETRAVYERLVSLEVWEKASVVAAYMALGSELDPRMIAEAALEKGKKLVLPVVNGRELLFRSLPDLGEENFKKGAFGIKEPEDSLPLWRPEEESGETLWLIPGVAFDRNCQRLGQGGGYYDRTLGDIRASRLRGHTFLGLAFSCQMADEIPRDEWDGALDLVITPGDIHINKHI